ncbi:MAG: hypothetical protein JWQ98_971 [Chlorobi bacterium]|nr:hypothetical protein [Chlorobiota bacterium]
MADILNNDETMGETGAPGDKPDPGTRAPAAGTQPAAGHISPAEKAEPAGVPAEEQRHNADPNAPQTTVVPPGETEVSELLTGGVAASSLQDAPDLGTDEARLRAQVPYGTPPPDAGAGSSSQENDPNVLSKE